MVSDCSGGIHLKCTYTTHYMTHICYMLGFFVTGCTIFSEWVLILIQPEYNIYQLY